MGEWARFTRRKFKWKEFRFECVYATPIIFLAVGHELEARDADQFPLTVLDGTEEMSEWPGLTPGNSANHHRTDYWKSEQKEVPGEPNPGSDSASSTQSRRRISRITTRDLVQYLRKKTPLLPAKTKLQRFLQLDKDPKGSRPENEPVSWIPLMQALQSYAASLRQCGLSVYGNVHSRSQLRGPTFAAAVRVSKKSWDFVPAEIVKPLALTNVRDIAIFVQQLGCKWTTFQPEDGVLRAEGEGIALSSTEVRQVGTVVNIMKTDDRIEVRRQIDGLLFSPLEEAAALGFGILPSDLFRVENYCVYSLLDCEDTICHLLNATTDIAGMQRPVLSTIITDLLGILTPVFRPAHTAITYVVKPSEIVSDEVISLRGSLGAFISSLDDLLGATSAAEAKNRHWENLKAIRLRANDFIRNRRWRPDQGRPIVSYGRCLDAEVVDLLDSLHEAWRVTSTFLSAHRATCRAVLSCHLAAMLEVRHELHNIHQEMPMRYSENVLPARQRLMKLYFDICRAQCVKVVSASTRDSPEAVQEVWVSIIYRGLLWHAIHNFSDRVVAVPPRYAHSNMPIYIA
jgi:hypothetical protein